MRVCWYLSATSFIAVLFMSADAQLAFMFKTGKIQLVLSEDSDLIAYGVTKMINQWQITRGMTLRYVDMERLNRVAMLNDSRLSNVEKYFVDNPERRNRVILLVLAAGCDYVGKVKGIGYTTALKILKAEGGPNQYASVIERLIQSKQPEDIPQHYLKRFEQALVVFEYQLAYDEARKEAVYWNEGIEEDSIAARHPDRTATGQAAAEAVRPGGAPPGAGSESPALGDSRAGGAATGNHRSQQHRAGQGSGAVAGARAQGW